MAGKRNNLGVAGGSSRFTGRLVFFCLSLFLFLSVTGLWSSAKADTISDNLRFSGDSTPVALENVVLSSSALTVGAPTQLQVRFTTPDLEFPFDYRVGVTFPAAFGFDGTVSATFSDDSPAPDPEIQNVEIIDHTVIFTFRRTFFAPKAGQTGIIDISGVTLPTVAGAYAATAFMSDIDFVVLAGPSFTSEILLQPDVAAAISLSPTLDIAASAGDLLTFSGNSVDKYGNAVSDSTLSWSLTANSDSLGAVTPGNLLVTKIGSGRVVVSSALAADTSGVITVVAGDLARLELDIDRQQFVGGGICGKALVRAFDQFDNPKANFSDADTLLRLSVSEGDIFPAVIPVGAFDSDGVLDLAEAAVRFEGFIGDVDLSVSQGGVVGSALSVAIGGISANLPLNDQLPTGKRIGTTLRISTAGLSLHEIDSLVAWLPDGNRVVVTSIRPLFFYSIVTLPEFYSPGAPTGSFDDSLIVSLYGTTRNSDTLSSETCSTVNTMRLSLMYLDEHIRHTAKVDTLLLRSSYGDYIGFGIESPFDAQGVTGGSLFIDDSLGGLFQIGSYSWGIIGPGIIDKQSLQIQAISSEVAPGLHGVTSIVSISDGPFEYKDTTFADSQIYLIEPARFIADTAGFSPRSGSPGDSVSFSVPVAIDGAFVGPFSVRATLQLYSANGLNQSDAIISDSKDIIRSLNPLNLPLEIAQTSWGVRFVIEIFEGNSSRTDTLDLGPDVFQVGPLTQIDIVNLGSDAPNFPFVSSGQELNLMARIVNNAPFEVDDVQVAVGATVVEVGVVAASDTVDVTIPFVAGAPTALELVTAKVTSAGGARAESEAQIRFTVQSPALLTLIADLNLEDGSDGQKIAELGTTLTLQLNLKNEGAATVSGGSALITAKGAGLDFTTIADISSLVTTVNLGVPSIAGSVVVIVGVLDRPVELNTANEAIFTMPAGASFGETVSIVDRELVVNANISVGDTTALVFGERREMFSVELNNRSALESADIKVETLVAFLRGSDGARIAPAEVIDVSRSALFDSQGKAIAILRISGDSLVMDVTPNMLRVGESVTYRFVAQFASKSAVRTFSLSVPTEAIALEVVSGPRDGARFVAQAPAGAPPFESTEYTLTAAAFVESFQPQNNPFNPNYGSTQFSYTLSEDGDIELAVYTLTGKLVRRYDFSSGSAFARAGVQTPAWDGRNGDGAIVRDGVYVVVLTNLNTGEKAYLKQAVLK